MDGMQRAAQLVRHWHRMGHNSDFIANELERLTKENMTTLLTYTCLRCTHEWIPRRNQLPKVCSKCKSKDWNKPRKSTPTQKS